MPNTLPINLKIKIEVRSPDPIHTPGVFEIRTLVYDFDKVYGAINHLSEIKLMNALTRDEAIEEALAHTAKSFIRELRKEEEKHKFRNGLKDLK